jgi:alpha-D-ribose 1-methylphosphonate 5-triphosphate synthase subunit PhnH
MTASPDTTAAGLGRFVHALALPPDTAQADFRALLAALARPGTLETITATPGAPPVLAVAAGLADVEVPLCVLTADGQDGRQDDEDQQDQARALHMATSAPVADLGDARLVAALRPPSEEEVAALRRGDALHPEHGARLVLAVDELSTLGDAGTGTVLTLTGPGVPGYRRIRVAGQPPEVFRALAAANTAFPAGVDTFLVATDGTVAGLPRSTRVSIENGEN